MINIFITTNHKNTKAPLKKRKVDCDDPQPTSSSNGNGTRYFSFQEGATSKNKLVAKK